MKKLSINLFALLALAFAVATAFTTKRTIDPGWYASLGSVEESNIPDEYSTALFDDEVLVSGEPSIGVSQGQCSADEGFVCAAEFNEDGEYIEDYVEGAFNF